MKVVQKCSKIKVPILLHLNKPVTKAALHFTVLQTTKAEPVHPPTAHNHPDTEMCSYVSLGFNHSPPTLLSDSAAALISGGPGKETWYRFDCTFGISLK